MKRTVWIFGALLLVASLVGAKLTLDQNVIAQGNRPANLDGKPQDKIVCLGYFDVEQGIVGLYPKQFGDVVYIAPETTRVKTGDLLLQINDTAAKLKVRLAEAGVKGAESQLAEAKLLPRLYELQVTEQNSAIAAIDLDIEKTKQDLQAKELELTRAEVNKALIQKQRDAYESGIKMLGEKKKAAQAKLEQIKLQDAKLKIGQAEAELDAKKIMKLEAEELVKAHRIEAPGDGEVLRVYTRKGEVLGSTPRNYALEFLPNAPIVVRAEVLQEWGHYVKVGQKVTIEDDTYKGPTWTGTVKSISGYYDRKRNPVIEPFTFNDVRTLECIITVDGGEARKFLGQRVRAKISGG